MVSVHDFSISFGNTKILENISFEVKNGEIVTLLGQSGCGKTTILRAIAGLQREHDGKICIGDVCVSSREVFEKDREVGYIFQDYALFPHLNVEENIAFALDKISKKDKQKRVEELLEQFDLKNHQYKSIHQLSGGQQQRVAIARAMANNPKILLLDEPFANLDSQLRQKTKIWLKNLIKDLNVSAILVTHDKKEALSISDKIGVINNKKLLQFDCVLDIFNNPNNYYVANFLSEINVIPKQIIEKLDLKIDDNQIAISYISKCKYTIQENDLLFEIKVVNSSFCGEYFENSVLFKNITESKEVILRSKEDLSKSNKLFISLKKEDIKIIPL